jgi:hypothetical protein
VHPPHGHRGSDKVCRLEILASLPGCSVSLCEHGTVHLAIGAVTLQLQRDSLPHLAELLAHASQAARRAPEPSTGDSLH